MHALKILNACLSSRHARTPLYYVKGICLLCVGVAGVGVGDEVTPTPPTYPRHTAQPGNKTKKRRCKIMGSERLTFEEALIDRLDVIGELLERIASALERSETID